MSREEKYGKGSVLGEKQRENGIYKIFNMEKQYSMEDGNCELKSWIYLKFCSARLDTSLICLHRIKYSLTSSCVNTIMKVQQLNKILQSVSKTKKFSLLLSGKNTYVRYASKVLNIVDVKRLCVTVTPSASKSWIRKNWLFKETIRRTKNNFDFPDMTISLTEDMSPFYCLWSIVTANFKVCTSRISEEKIQLKSLTCLKFRVVQGILQRISYFEG